MRTQGTRPVCYGPLLVYLLCSQGPKGALWGLRQQALGVALKELPEEEGRVDRETPTQSRGLEWIFRMDPRPFPFLTPFILQVYRGPGTGSRCQGHRAHRGLWVLVTLTLGLLGHSQIWCRVPPLGGSLVF